MKKVFNTKGVSLVEMVVVLGLFSITLTVVLTILLSALKDQRQIRADQAVVGATRDALEAMAREIRLGYIDYTQYQGGELDIPVHVLHIKAADGVTNYHFGLLSGQLMSDFNAGNSLPLSSYDIEISGLDFYVRPVSDPYYLKACTEANEQTDCVYPAMSPPDCGVAGVCEVENIQPHITIVMHAVNRNPGAGTFATINLQTTMAVRTYRR